MSEDRIAQCALLAMLLELSSNPKPGNVDRHHDFSDLTFQQFLASAVFAYPVFRKAAGGEGRLGQLLLEAVRSWRAWGLSGNTHFGSLVLLMPLVMAAGRSSGGTDELKNVLETVLRETNVDDALDFYTAFELARARVGEVAEFSLKDPGARDHLQAAAKTLLDLMKLSLEHDLIAREWSTNYCRCFLLSDALLQNVACHGLNGGVVKTYLQALSQAPDSLVEAKFGLQKAMQVSLRAGAALNDETLSMAEELDRELLAEDVNPGSTADLVAASLFIALLRGLRL